MLAILRSHEEIRSARRELTMRGLSCNSSGLIQRLRNRRLLPGVTVGHELKSWDVLRTASFVENRLDKRSGVLDLGAYASEILCVLHRLGYANLSGVDLDPRVRQMPYSSRIDYQVGDFLEVPIAPASFGAVTAISVIEHGFDSRRLLDRVSSLLRPGGFFIASFDYWPSKIDTSDTRMFGMDWRIFSRSELDDFREQARAVGLHCDAAASPEPEERVINWARKRYTFAWIAFEKRAT